MYLYRGVSCDFYQKTGGALLPKAQNKFEYVFRLDGAISLDGSAKIGVCEHNAVLRHELRQEGYPTSGISTTPHFHRALFYAFHGGMFPEAFVYKIDRHLLSKCGVREFIVSEYLLYPSVPEDDEIILVAKDYGSFPDSIVVEVLKVTSCA